MLLVDAGAVALAILIGLVVGWALQLTRIPRLGQDIGAMIIASVLGFVVATAVLLAWLLRPTEPGGIGAVSLGFGEGIVLLTVVLIPAAVVLHFVFQRLHVGSKALSGRSPVILGAIGGLLAALWALFSAQVSG